MTAAPQSVGFTWNLVTKGVPESELVRRKLGRYLSKLGRHLRHFPPDAVHLHVALERHPKTHRCTAALTLRVPSNILRSEKSANDVVQALDRAMAALLRETESLKAELRREQAWKRKRRRAALREGPSVGFAPAPEPEGRGPQTLGDAVRELLSANYARLLRYVRRQLWHDIAAGELPPGAVDPRAVVDEAAARALADPRRKPADMTYLLWFYALARRELARRRKAAAAVRLDRPRVLPEEAGLAEGYDPDQPLDIIERRLEPPVAATGDLVPDTRAATPEEALARRELLAELRRVVRTWPKPERDAFELHYVEGFEPDEVAMILGQPLARVRELLRSVQDRLRAAVLEQALL
jgi:RNA polymerase sigma factor (sigma-70 family)